MLKLPNKILLQTILGIFSFLLVDLTFLSDASAGILFRNRRQVIRTTAPQFQQQNYQVTRSTVALRRTSGPITSQPIGTVDNHAKLIRNYNRYEERLAKWEQKQAKNLQKRKEKERRLSEKEQKRRAREITRLKKKQEFEARKNAKQLDRSQTSTAQALVTSPASSPSSRGALSGGSSSQLSGAQKSSNGKGFWRRLLDALFGTKS